MFAPKLGFFELIFFYEKTPSRFHVLETFRIETFSSIFTEKVEKVQETGNKSEVSTKSIIKVFRKSNKVVKGEINAVRSLLTIKLNCLILKFHVLAI